MPSLAASACPAASIDKKNGSVELPGTNAIVNFLPLLLALLEVELALVLPAAAAVVPEPLGLLELLEHAAAPMASPPARAAHSIDFLITIGLPLCLRCRSVCGVVVVPSALPLRKRCPKTHHVSIERSRVQTNLVSKLLHRCLNWYQRRVPRSPTTHRTGKISH
jgi:hypothetical protein